MYEDNSDEKLRMKEQTEMKHRILQHYLDPWIKKISTVESDLLFVDGFAGPGVYPDGSDGSPLIAMEIADELLSESTALDKRIETFDCIFVEKNSDNFEDLEDSVSSRSEYLDERISPECINTEFEEWAREFIADHRKSQPPPSLVFIDPFGYSGIPFELISDLYQLREQSLELLVTFMAGKMAQWMSDPNHQIAISETLGIDHWEDEMAEDTGKNERAEVFASIYQDQLEAEADAEYTLPFEMVEESKRQTCYYLIHVTNHFEGLKVMKETMFNAGADDHFAYLGPDHTGYESSQLSFEAFGETNDFAERVESFAEELHTRYKGEDVVFRDVLEDTLDQNVFKVTHYRDAFDVLKERKDLEVKHRPDHPDGNISHGYGEGDLIQFVEMDLTSFWD